MGGGRIKPIDMFESVPGCARGGVRDVHKLTKQGSDGPSVK
jgi:hypothetical protein